VERIEVRDDRVTSVTVHSPDGRRELSADTVVLCAGTYNSPALLIRSGIGPAEELARHGIDAVLPLPVGERLREHFGVPVRFAASEKMDERVTQYLNGHAAFPFNGVIKARTSGCPEGRWDLILLLALFPGPVLSSSAMLMRPEWSGTVRLRSADPRDLPMVSEPSLDSDRDAEAAFEGIELARRLTSSTALSELVAEELAPGPGATPQEVRSRGREGLTTFFHPVGTCPMGDGGVTDSEGRVRGIENLYVADASILPEIPPVPTNITVLAAAEKVAAGLRGGATG
jgi:choline dehydrogenase